MTAPAAAVRLLEVPPACCFGLPAGLVRGVATGVDPDSAAIALYAATDLEYVQPLEGSRLALDSQGGFESPTHGGTDYAALLVRRDYLPPPTFAVLPAAGGPVLAVARASDTIRHIQFAGRSWGVKAAPVALGPGGNRWSDGPESVWVDAAGALHLRLARRDSVWECAEVWTEDRVDFGRFRFEVTSPLGRLDPNVVFAGFLFADTGAEADIEWGHFGDPATDNLRFVVQPDQSTSTSVLVDGVTTQEMTWRPEAMDFAVRDAANAPIAAWHAAGASPAPEWMRLRFNLWLAGGAPPGDGLPAEVVLRSVAFDAPTATAEITPAPVALVVANPASRGHLEIHTTLIDAAGGSIDIFDVQGRRVGRAWSGPLNRTAIVWPPRTAPHLPAGVYVVRLTARAGSVARKVVVAPLAP